MRIDTRLGGQWAILSELVHEKPPGWALSLALRVGVIVFVFGAVAYAWL